MTNDPPDQSVEWNSTASGLLTGYAHRQQRRRLLGLAAKTAGATGCLAALGFGGWLEYVRRLETEYQHFGLTCSDIRELMPAYRAGKLDAERSRILEKHVRKCSSCENYRKELRETTV